MVSFCNMLMFVRQMSKLLEVVVSEDCQWFVNGFKPGVVYVYDENSWPIHEKVSACRFPVASNKVEDVISFFLRFVCSVLSPFEPTQKYN